MVQSRLDLKNVVWKTNQGSQGIVLVLSTYICNYCMCIVIFSGFSNCENVLHWNLAFACFTLSFHFKAPVGEAGKEQVTNNYDWRVPLWVWFADCSKIHVNTSIRFWKLYNSCRCYSQKLIFKVCRHNVLKMYEIVLMCWLKLLDLCFSVSHSDALVGHFLM